MVFSVSSSSRQILRREPFGHVGRQPLHGVQVAPQHAVHPQKLGEERPPALGLGVGVLECGHARYVAPMSATAPRTSHNSIYIAFVPWVLFSVISRHDTMKAADAARARRRRHHRDPRASATAGPRSSSSAPSPPSSRSRWSPSSSIRPRTTGSSATAARSPPRCWPLIAFGSLAVDLPFTEQYARESVPEQYWSSPRFKSRQPPAHPDVGRASSRSFVPRHIIAGYVEHPALEHDLQLGHPDLPGRAGHQTHRRRQRGERAK